MLTLKECLEAIEYRVTSGYHYTWHCFGPHAYGLECSSFEFCDKEIYNFSMIFDYKSHIVYSAEIHDYARENSYRMINPAYVDVYKDEVIKTLGSIDHDTAYDFVPYIDLDNTQDFLSKVNSIVNERPYDTRVSIPIDLEDHEIFELMKRAHEQDITLNKLIENILTTVIEREKNKQPDK